MTGKAGNWRVLMDSDERADAFAFMAAAEELDRLTD